MLWFNDFTTLTAQISDIVWSVWTIFLLCGVGLLLTLKTRFVQITHFSTALKLLFGVALLCFAHGANDVANAVGPLAAIVSTLATESSIATKVSIPLWVMVVGAIGIALGLFLFGPKLINTVGQKITRLNAPRAYCVALSSAITVLIATTLGLPVSSTHIAIGAIFGVGFLREYLENPNSKLNEKTMSKRMLVRRKFLFSIAGAWLITVPASAIIASLIYLFLDYTFV